MKCSGCKEPLTAELVRPGPTGFIFEPYCSRCAHSPRCPHCGTSYAAFQKKRLLSCQHCYSAFQPELVLLLRRFRSKQKISVQPEIVSAAAQMRSRDLLERSSGLAEETVQSNEREFFIKEIPGEIVRLRMMRNIHGLPYGKITYNIVNFLSIATETERPSGIFTQLYSGDEDHIRYECLARRQDFSGAIPYLQTQLQVLSGLFVFQFHPQFGYLAACPTNSGGGIRLSLSLPLNAMPGSVGRRVLARSGFELRLPGRERFELSNRFSSWPFDIAATLERMERALSEAAW